jgi:hypothetical protein
MYYVHFPLGNLFSTLPCFHPHLFLPVLRLTSLNTGEGIFKDSPTTTNAENRFFRKSVFYFEAE